MALIRKQDTASLLTNGHFSSGLFGWSFIGDVRHVTYPQGGTGSFTPEFAAVIPPNGRIYQDLSRPDLYSYPSRQFIENVLGVPVGENTIAASSLPNSRFDPPVSEIETDMRRLEPGSQIGVRDLTDYSRSDTYRAGPITYINGAASIEISPLSHPVPKLYTHADFAGMTLVVNPPDNFSTAGNTANAQILRAYGTIQVGQYLITQTPTFAVCRISSAVRLADRWVVGLQKVEGYPFFAYNSVSPGIPVNTWFIAEQRSFNLFYDAPLFRYEFTLALTTKDGVQPATPPILTLVPIAVNAGVGAEGDPIQIKPAKLDNDKYVELVSNTKGTGVAVSWIRLIYRYIIELPAPIIGYMRLSIAAQVDRELIVGSATLFKGNYSSRHYFYRDDTPTTGEKPNPPRVDPADNTDAIDRLFNGADMNYSAIPKGSVILYLGEACPPGYKRVDAGPGSLINGIGRTVPKPHDAVYDLERDRTVLTWNNVAFDLLDENNQPIPIPSDQFEIVEQLPSSISSSAWANNRTEIIKYGPNQPWIQPGMSLRIRSTDEDYGRGRELDYSTLVRQVAVTRTPSSQATRYYSSIEFDFGEFDIPPAGPPKSTQPSDVLVAGTANIQRGSATIVVPNIDSTNVDIYVGRRFYVRWVYPGGATHGFIGLVDRADLIFQDDGLSRYTLTIRRYDGYPMVVDETDMTVSVAVSLSSAEVFNAADVVTRMYTVQTQGSARTRAVIWSVRRFTSTTEISVNGDVVSDILSFNSVVMVEPTGYIKFGDPANYFDYGSMGHSHEITRGDAVLNSNLAPVSISTGYSIPEVAREHGHGFMPKHTYPIPQFIAYLVCEKI